MERMVMNMKKIIVVLLTLVIVLVFVPTASTNPDNSSYDPMADVSRDGVIDIYDLARLGEAYGTTQTVPTIPNQTVVYVYQIEKDPAEVENARVAIVDPNYYYETVQVNYTNSSGLVSFTLNPNSNYTAIVWSNATYNFANFTTNHFGEASVVIQLGYPHLPSNWVVITLLNKTSRELVFWPTPIYVGIGQIAYDKQNQSWLPIWDGSFVFEENFIGVVTVSEWGEIQPGTSYGLVVYNQFEEVLASPVYTTDENGTADVVIYID